LPIKKNLSRECIEVIIKKFQEAQKALNDLSSANNMLSLRNLSKNLLLNSAEKLSIETIIKLGSQLIQSAQNTGSKLQEILAEYQKSDITKQEAEALMQEQLLAFCELLQSIESLKIFAEKNIEPPNFSKPLWIKVLESDVLDNILSCFPSLATSVLGCLLLAHVVIFTALQAAILTLIFSVSAYGIKTLAALTVSGYEHRIEQKTEDKRVIKEEILANLNQFLNKELTVSGLGGIPAKLVNTHTSQVINQAGERVGTELKEIKELLLRQSQQTNMSDAERAPMSLAVQKSFREEVKNLRNGLNNSEYTIQQQDQILASLITKGLQAKNLYGEAVKKLVEELEIPLEKKTSLSIFLFTTGERYWVALRDLQKCYAEDERWEGLCDLADIKIENVPSSHNKIKVLSSDIVLNTG